MKKLIIASAISMTMASGAAMAADANTSQTGEVTFIGSVTAKTCDLAPSVGGIMSDVIDLGTIDVGSESTEKQFALVKKAGTSCVLDESTSADVTWGGTFTAKGLANTKGTAQDAYVILTANGVDAANTNAQITAGKQTVNFTKVKEKLDADGLQFSAKLKSDNVSGTAGSFLSTAYYAVAYK
ncbi:TPA: hypothetical protein JLQ01_004464 [Escherichia coli]|nr:hypothetical protein [Escherichia coli]HAW2557469.1 hypothetical protein [Escherichia coli]HAW2582013.1 hypothetical protein [Escherichia coli]